MDDQVKKYREKVLRHINNEFKNRKGKILDVGCGDCGDGAIFIERGMSVYGIDIYQDKDAKKILGKRFKKGSILKIPFKDNSFDYVFAKDVLHHIDEEEQKKTLHIQGLREVQRVCKKGGKIIILEANRYNPFFYAHMVLLNKHNHFTQSYFIKLVETVFIKPKFIFFEAHFYPEKMKRFFVPYEKIMEYIPFLRPFSAYNLMISKK